MQTSLCNQHHSVVQRLSRMLLQNLDRLQSNSIKMTQELIANVLGTRRERVSEAAGSLQRAGLIRYRRGYIDVLDRPGLEDVACECYAAVKAEFNCLFSDTAKPLGRRRTIN